MAGWMKKTETSNQVDTRSFDASIKQVDDQRRRVIYSLGEEFFKDNKNCENLPESYKNKIDMINKLEYNHKVWFNRKLKAMGMRRCEGCGNELPYESYFCNRCGMKLAPVAEELVIVSENE